MGETEGGGGGKNFEKHHSSCPQLYFKIAT